MILNLLVASELKSTVCALVLVLIVEFILSVVSCAQSTSIASITRKEYSIVYALQCFRMLGFKIILMLAKLAGSWSLQTSYKVFIFPHKLALKITVYCNTL